MSSSCCTSDSSSSSDESSKCSCSEIDEKAEKKKKKKNKNKKKEKNKKKNKKEINVCATPCKCCECTLCRDCGCVEDQKKPCGATCTCCECSSPKDNIYCGCPEKGDVGGGSKVDSGNFGQRISKILGVDKIKEPVQIIRCDCGEENCPRTGCPKPVKPFVEEIPEDDKKKVKKKPEAPKCDKECQEKKSCMPFCKRKEPELVKNNAIEQLYTSRDNSGYGEGETNDKQNTQYMKRSDEKVHFNNSRSNENQARDNGSHNRSENGRSHKNAENKDLEMDNSNKCPLCLSCDATGETGKSKKSKKEQLKKCPAFSSQSSTESSEPEKKQKSKTKCGCSKQNKKRSKEKKKKKTSKVTCRCKKKKKKKEKKNKKKKSSKSTCSCKQEEQPDESETDSDSEENKLSESSEEDCSCRPVAQNDVSGFQSKVKETGYSNQRKSYPEEQFEEPAYNNSHQRKSYPEDEFDEAQFDQQERSGNNEITYIECPAYEGKKEKTIERAHFDNCNCKAINAKNEIDSRRVNGKERSPSVCKCNSPDNDRVQQEIRQPNEESSMACQCMPNQQQSEMDGSSMRPSKYCPVFDGPKTCPRKKPKHENPVLLSDEAEDISKKNSKKDNELKQNDSLESIYICTYKMLKGIDE